MKEQENKQTNRYLLFLNTYLDGCCSETQDISDTFMFSTNDIETLFYYLNEYNKQNDINITNYDYIYSIIDTLTLKYHNHITNYEYDKLRWFNLGD